MRDWPWQMWVYFGIGLLVALWYMRREGDPHKEHTSQAQYLVLGLLAFMWPILLLAMLVNQPDKPKAKDSPPKPKDPT